MTPWAGLLPIPGNGPDFRAGLAIGKEKVERAGDELVTRTVSNSTESPLPRAPTRSWSTPRHSRWISLPRRVPLSLQFGDVRVEGPPEHYAYEPTVRDSASLSVGCER
jgi:hypothetical protein